MFHFLTGDPAAVNPMGTLLYWVVLIAVFGLMFYFMAIRPQKKQQKKTLLAVALAFVIGMECGFMGSAGGALMLMVLTIVLGMDTKLAVGTNSMIMALVALTGAVSHVAMGAQVELIPGIIVTVVCTAAAVVSARFANKVSERVLNVSTGIVLIAVSLLSLILGA